MSLAIGLACLPRATSHPVPQPITSAKPSDDHLWTDMDIWDTGLDRRSR